MRTPKRLYFARLYISLLNLPVSGYNMGDFWHSS